LSGLKGSGIERYPIICQKWAAGTYFYYLENGVKNSSIFKIIFLIVLHLENSHKFNEIRKILSLWALLSGVLQVIISKKYFLIIFQRYFYRSKSRFRQQVLGLSLYRFLRALKVSRKSVGHL